MTLDTSDPYVGYHTASGTLQRLSLDLGRAPVDGAEENGLIVHRIPHLGGLTEEEWMNTKIWNGTEYVTVDPKPNLHAFWNAETQEWDWDSEKVMTEVRMERDKLLSVTDFVLLPDAPLSDIQKEEVKIYRQALRDLPSLITWKIVNKYEVEFPVKPDFL